MRTGMRLSINSSTVIMVPASISRTFQFTAGSAADTGRIPVIMKTAAAHSAMIHLFSEKTISNTYIAANSMIASVI